MKVQQSPPSSPSGYLFEDQTRQTVATANAAFSRMDNPAKMAEYGLENPLHVPSAGLKVGITRFTNSAGHDAIKCAYQAVKAIDDKKFSEVLQTGQQDEILNTCLKSAKEKLEICLKELNKKRPVEKEALSYLLIKDRLEIMLIDTQARMQQLELLPVLLADDYKIVQKCLENYDAKEWESVKDTTSLLEKTRTVKDCKTERSIKKPLSVPLQTLLETKPVILKNLKEYQKFAAAKKEIDGFKKALEDLNGILDGKNHKIGQVERCKKVILLQKLKDLKIEIKQLKAAAKEACLEDIDNLILAYNEAMEKINQLFKEPVGKSVAKPKIIVPVEEPSLEQLANEIAPTDYKFWNEEHRLKEMLSKKLNLLCFYRLALKHGKTTTNSGKKEINIKESSVELEKEISELASKLEKTNSRKAGLMPLVRQYLTKQEEK